MQNVLRLTYEISFLLSSQLVNDRPQRLQLQLAQGWCCGVSFCLLRGTPGWLASGASVREGEMVVTRGRFSNQFAVSEVTGRQGAAAMAELAWFPCFCLQPL